MSNTLELVQFRSKPLSEWLDYVHVDIRSHMMTRGEWDPHGLQSLITSITERLNKSYECLTIARDEWISNKRQNKKLFNDEMDAAVARTGGRAQVTALRANVESKLKNEYDREALLEAVKEFWETQIERLNKMNDSARQLSYLQNAKTRLE